MRQLSLSFALEEEAKRPVRGRGRGSRAKEASKASDALFRTRNS